MPPPEHAATARWGALVTSAGTLTRRLAGLGAVLALWEPLLWTALAALAAAVVPLRYALGQNSDGLVQTLISLQHLTVFFWDQDRFANLLPWLTAGIADPFANAAAQLALRIGLGLLAPLLFCIPAAERWDAWRATLLASALTLGLAPQRFIHELFVEASPYGTSFALAGLALVALRQAGRAQGGPALALRAAGLALTCAAYMVNASLVLLTMPLFALQAVLLGSALAMEFAVASAIAGAVTAAMVGLAADGAPGASTRFGETTIGLVHYATELTKKPGLFLAGMAALFLAAALAGRRRAFVQQGAVMLATFVVALTAISLSSWVLLNFLHPRYLVPLYVLMSALGALSLLELARAIRPAARNGAVLAACAVVLVVAARRTQELSHGQDGIVAAEFRPVAEAVADAISAQRLDGVAGDYWTVWPAVFLAEQQAHDAGRKTGGVFGLTYRGKARRDAILARLRAQQRLTIACLDQAPAGCGMFAEDTMGLDVTAQPIGPARPLPGGHSLTIVRLERAGAGH